PSFLYRREPNSLHSQDSFLFWSIICVTSRKPALDPVARVTLECVSYAALANEVKKAVADFGINPPKKLSTIQGFLLLCEWPLPASRICDDRVWHYSSLASGTCYSVIQYGLKMGYHRPHYAHEYSDRLTEQPIPESTDGHERILTWIVTLAGTGTTVSLASSAAFGHTPSWLARIPRKVLDTLRISRLDQCVAQALGNLKLSPSGQLPATNTTSLFSVFLSELNDLKRNVTSRDAATTLQLHICRKRMRTFELQSKRAASSATTRALAATDYYVSFMRIAEAACTIPRDEVARWPFYISLKYSFACICLIRLLSTEDGRSLDMNAALTQNSAVFRVASEINVSEDSLRRRFDHLISFSVKDAHARRLQLSAPIDSRTDETSVVHSRMGL
ncbi:hypothetical protein FIBSPDRAFT_742997, partial [Athelia psychrophila]